MPWITLSIARKFSPHGRVGALAYPRRKAAPLDPSQTPMEGQNGRKTVTRETGEKPERNRGEKP